ncbi:ferrous iron transport protein A [Chloroflexota bacterium]
MYGFMRRFRPRFGPRLSHKFRPEGKRLALAIMRSGQNGIVVQILGGHGLINRLSALGIRPGQRVTKISSMFMRGPITIQIGNAQVAIGFGMAMRIIVEPVQ